MAPLGPRFPRRGPSTPALPTRCRKGRAFPFDRWRCCKAPTFLPGPWPPVSSRPAASPGCLRAPRTTSGRSSVCPRRRDQARAFHRVDLLDRDLLRIIGPGQIHAGGHQVDQMPRLLLQFALPRDSRRPVGDQRRGDAALVHEMLVLAERACCSRWPTPCRKQGMCRRGRAARCARQARASRRASASAASASG